MTAPVTGMISPALFSRRTMLQVSAAASGGLLLGFNMDPTLAKGKSAPAPLNSLNPNAFIQIDDNGDVTFTIPQEEMGQGVYTSLSQLLADELDVPFNRVRVAAAPPIEPTYSNPDAHIMVTGGSTSIRSFYTLFRKVGASGRAMLIQAAAGELKVAPASLRTENGEVIHDQTGRRLAYGKLARLAAAIPVPQDPPLKAEKDFKLIGKPIKRLDTPDKVQGKALFGIDMRLPGMKVAALAASPVVGGKVARVDDSQIKNVPGARQVVVLDDLVAVVGDHMWAAKQGLAALDITWNLGANAAVNSEHLWEELRAASERKGAVAKVVGDTNKGLSQGVRIDAAYELPFLAHATMEPQNFTVHVTSGSCEMWGGSQMQAVAVRAAAKALGIDPKNVTFHNLMLGGGFGRRLDVDMVVKAVRIAQKIDGPVKVVWTREEDIQQDIYRPAYRNVMSASVAPDGKIVGWLHRIAAGSVAVRLSGTPLKDGLDPQNVDGALDNSYDIPNFRVEYIEAEPRALQIGYWRGVAPNNSIFAIESLVDELAKKANKDPVDFRLGMLQKNPRLKAVLELAAGKSGWGNALPERAARGVCAQFAFGTYLATVAEVEVDKAGEVHLRRFTSAVDAGRIVNPDTLIAQIQGGLIFGLTAALYGEITLKNGRVMQSNFNNYRMMRINEAPAIDVHLIRSEAAPGGIGEPGCTAGPPALVNAIAAATGVRLRRLPIDRNLLLAQKTV